MHTNQRLPKRFVLPALAAITINLLLPTLVSRKVQAANLTEAMMRLDRMAISVTDNQILVVAKPVSTATENAIRVTFAAGFTVDATPANITTATAGIPATIQGEAVTAWPTIGASASTVAGQVVTFSSGDLTPGTLYAFYITAGIDNPGVAAQYENTITTRDGSGDVDTTNLATRIINNDQVVITATVPPTFSFALSGNSDTFTADLDSSAITSTNGITVTIGTNANNGWVTWLRSANQGLDSATTGETIDTQGGAINDACTTLVAGSDYYQLDVNLTTDHATGNGTVTIDAEYNCGASEGGTFSSTFEEIATANGTTAGDVITMIAKATMTAVKSAADDYTDTWTVVGAANF